MIIEFLKKTLISHDTVIYNCNDLSVADPGISKPGDVVLAVEGSF